MSADRATRLLDDAAVAQERGDMDRSGHLLVLASRALVRLAAADRLEELLTALTLARRGAVEMVAGQLAQECASAAWIPQGEGEES